MQSSQKPKTHGQKTKVWRNQKNQRKNFSHPLLNYNPQKLEKKNKKRKKKTEKYKTRGETDIYPLQRKKKKEGKK